MPDLVKGASLAAIFEKKHQNWSGEELFFVLPVNCKWLA